MDIFTTALTRVAQVPIKPANNKVKAPSKTASTGEIKEDLDNLENHDSFLDEKRLAEQGHHNENAQNDQEHQQKDAQEHESKNKDAQKENNTEFDETVDGITQSEDGTKHLDLYI